MIFLDASAAVAILAREPQSERLEATLFAANQVITSPIAVWEALIALVRIGGHDFHEAGEALAELRFLARVELVPISAPELDLAAKAYDRFGKGRHPARLNMGDCFAYAIAKTHGAKLLAIGDDFAQTDIALATY